jgi:hypothetical protein
MLFGSQHAGFVHLRYPMLGFKFRRRQTTLISESLSQTDNTKHLLGKHDQEKNVEDLLNKKVVNSYFCSQVLHRLSIRGITNIYGIYRVTRRDIEKVGWLDGFRKPDLLHTYRLNQKRKRGNNRQQRIKDQWVLRKDRENQSSQHSGIQPMLNLLEGTQNQVQVHREKFFGKFKGLLFQRDEGTVNTEKKKYFAIFLFSNHY